MVRNTLNVLGMMLIGAGWLAVSGIAAAQYRCGVAIEQKGKAIFKGEIRDTERPSTDELWNLLKTLSFTPGKGVKDLPADKSVEQATLEGDFRVKINGAGQVDVKDLSLVRNKLSANAWVIAPDDVTRILQARKGQSGAQPKK